MYHCCEGCCFLNFILSPFFICIPKGYWFVWVYFISSHFAEVLFISYSSLVEFFWLLMHTILSSANIHTFTSLPIGILSISFYCLIFLARTWSAIFNGYRDSVHPCLVSDFSGIASSISPFNLILAVGLLYIAFIMFT